MDSDSSISVINFIFTDIRHTTIYAFLWDIFSVPNTVVSRGTPVYNTICAIYVLYFSYALVQYLRSPIMALAYFGCGVNIRSTLHSSFVIHLS